MIETNVVPSTLDTRKVERDSRTMKTGLLDVRPIFLRNKGRTKGYVFISMLALKITRQISSGGVVLENYNTWRATLPVSPEDAEMFGGSTDSILINYFGDINLMLEHCLKKLGMRAL